MSLRLKSLKEAPPNGFQFYQPETKWRIQTWGFAELVQSIIKHRQANPQFNLATDEATVAEEANQANALRVSKIPGADSYVTNDGGPSDPKSLLSHNRFARVRGVVAGAKSLTDWLGSGGVPVANDLAETRATRCTDCPNNSPQDLEDFFTVVASEMIRKTLNLRKDMNISTPLDDKLGVCDACYCPIRLLVHVPLEYKLRHMPPFAQEKLWSKCWVKTEQSPPA